ncbi:MAG: D-alanine--D-alanine ligase [Ignavibacteria bacterium]|nr:D-alanine--D-alanine ligase [Ignavibacteria bacterium]
MKIILLAGGSSPEREISLRSGKAIYKALIELGHQVDLVDPALGKNQPNNVDDFFAPSLNKEKVSTKNYIDAFQLEMFKNCDLVFIILHGKWGEDGTVQSILDLMNVKYTGSGVLPNSICIDKSLTKVIVKHFGVTTPDWKLLSRNDKANLFSAVEEIGLPCIFKPNDQGSTIGFSLVQSFDEIENAFFEALKFSDYVLIEKYIKGRELTVSILGNEALPIIEVKPKHQLYDYECKYTKGMTEYICPAEVDEKIAKEIQQQALVAFNACKCEVFGRVDFILDEKNIPYFLEINTIPGMTDLSLVPMAAKAVGISFNELISKIIELSLK